MTKTNAKSSEIGHEYQHILALEMILKSGDDEIIYIEECGDLANSDSTIEVKHHFDHPSLSNRSIDLWKTLYNWCNEYNFYKKYSTLIFHTTSRLPEHSYLKDWNNLLGEKRYEIIKKIILEGFTQETENYFNFIDGLDKNLLLPILEKVLLSVNNEIIEDKIDNLIKKESCFKLVKNSDNRRDLMKYLLGVLKYNYINKKEINVGEFFSQVRPQINRYQAYEYVISAFKKDETLNKNIYISSNFLKELGQINIDEKNQAMSIQEYIYMKNVLIESSKSPPLIKELTSKFIPEVLEKAELKKGEYSRDKKSYELFFDITQRAELIKNDFFENNRSFQNGNLHNIVNEGEFSWLYI